MQRFSANYIFPINQAPIRNGIVEVADDGVILRVFHPGNSPKEIHSTEFYNGVIVPGFVNAHCHLELSHLRGKIPRNLGIAGFIKAITEQRETELDAQDPKKLVEKAIVGAIHEMKQTGTVAVGDISNSTDTLLPKLQSDIYFHNFIEVFGLNPEEAQSTFESYLEVYKSFKSRFSNSTSLTPHSPYSISQPLWEKISEFIGKSKELVSIHYAESAAEYQFLQNGTGPLSDRYQSAGIPFCKPHGLTPGEVVSRYVTQACKVMFIHNTFAAARELEELAALYPQVTLVTCPESNMLIEGKLPNLTEFLASNLSIAIGTDSLASASSLSMLDQMNIVLQHFPQLSFNEVLCWATLNGANGLGISNMFGSIEPGKKPGLVLITGFDFQNMRTTPQSLVKKLI